MKNPALTWIAVLAVGVGFVYWKTRPIPMMPPGIELSRLATAAEQVDPCSGRAHCVILYLAPWCPHCRSMISRVPELRGFWSSAERPGFKVIVGNDKDAAVEEMARQIGEPVFLDRKKDFLNRMNISFFPSWFVVDAQGRVLKAGKSAISWVNDEVNSKR